MPNRAASIKAGILPEAGKSFLTGTLIRGHHLSAKLRGSLTVLAERLHSRIPRSPSEAEICASSLTQWICSNLMGCKWGEGLEACHSRNFCHLPLSYHQLSQALNSASYSEHIYFTLTRRLSWHPLHFVISLYLHVFTKQSYKWNGTITQLHATCWRNISQGRFVVFEPFQTMISFYFDIL